MEKEVLKQAVLRAQRPLHENVATALAEQNAKLAPSAARDRHVALLQGGAAAVVTGQQAGLFLGPLFTIYKAASAIVIARVMAAETGRPVVPVFWLQNEDHDLAEIARTFVPSKSGAARELALPADPAARISVAHQHLTDEVSSLLQALRDELGNLPHADPHLSRLERCYQPGASWSDAFGALLAELFADQGLVLFDPNDRSIAARAAQIHRRALIDAETIAQRLIDRVSELDSAPVHVRPGAPLSFFHPAGFEGPRYRLLPQEGAFAEQGGQGVHTREALLAALEHDPRSFSSSALLRPIVQDSLLPSAAYVGGPAEVAYFSQIEPLYGHFDLPMPLVLPRAKFRIVEEKARRLLSRLGIEAADAALPEEQILSRVREAADLEPAAVKTFLTDHLDAALGELRARIYGEQLGPAFDKTRATIEMAATKLAEKYEKALLHRDQTRVDEVRRLKVLLHPNGTPQERVYGPAYFFARYGEASLLDRILSAIDPFDGTVRDLELQ